MAALSEQYLREVGFRWEQLDRCPHKHWLLWLGLAAADDFQMQVSESLGIEVTKGDDAGNWWYCWIRADYAGRYSRLIHVRHIKTTKDLVGIIEGLTGQEFRRDYVWYGGLVKPEQAEKYQKKRGAVGREVSH